MSIPNFDTDLPQYFPVHLSLRVNTDFLSVGLLNRIDDQILALKKSTDAYLDYVGANTHLVDDKCTRFLQQQLACYTRLFGAKFRLQTLQNTLKAAHREFVDSRRHEQDLSLANYQVYQEVEKANFADRIVGELCGALDGAGRAALDGAGRAARPPTGAQSQYDDILRADSVHHFLKNARFVLEHPEDPLPEDGENEELAVAGGKISLKDPLLLNYFVHPVMSRKCGHVYEREHIASQMDSHALLNCPVTGCEETVARADLRDDKLMALRVRVFLGRARAARGALARAARI